MDEEQEDLAGKVSGEAYQIIGALADAAGLFYDEAVIRALDYFGYEQWRNPGAEILPWHPKRDAPPPGLSQTTREEVRMDEKYDVIIYGGNGGMATGFARGFTPGATMLVLDPGDGGDYSAIPDGARLERHAVMASVNVRDLGPGGAFLNERTVNTGDPVDAGRRYEITAVTLTDGRTFGCGHLVDCVGAVNQGPSWAGRASV
ncbi:hypothetical protein [Methylobacterium sp. WL19]|uniref:hypothetical protein n=1 Tax=Methylobacterium sp. WL19 TaxID=2603896 RepID=UPI0011CB7BBD|nr:hypothetical protein [Methylobacterium sp. WL19]TXN33871.1 hypothetical protein FV220_00010 [Methylobacterium sp. WL19]